MYELMIEDTFDAAHQLVGYKGPCENLHGHTWRTQIFLEGEKLDDLGMLFDFRKAKKILSKKLKEFDHRNLNEHPVFRKQSSTSENIAQYLYGELKKSFGKEVCLTKVTVWESGKTWANYSG